MLRAVGFGLGGVAYGLFLALLIDRVLARRSIRPGAGARASWVRAVTAVSIVGLAIGSAVDFARVYVAAMTAAFLGVLVALAVIDARHRILPNAIVYPSLVIFAAAVIVGAAAGQGVSARQAIIGLGAFGLPMLVLALLSPGGMGMGDVKLAALIGLVLGSLGLRYVAVAAGVGVIGGGVASVIALVAGRSRKSSLPFGPSLSMGAIVATFFAPAIARAYLR